MLVIVGMPSSSMRCLNTSSVRASDRPTEPLRRRASAIPKSTSTPGGVERDADVADAGAGRHAGHVGDGEQLRRGAVEPGAARAHPHADRNRGVGDADEQVLDLVVADERAVAVDLQDQGLRPLARRPDRWPSRSSTSDRIESTRSPGARRPGRRRRSSSSAVGPRRCGGRRRLGGRIGRSSPCATRATAAT